MSRDRDDRRQFENDVYYEAWRRGMDPDRAVDCADDCYYAGRRPDECVDDHEAQMSRQRRATQEEADYYEHQHYLAMQEQEREHEEWLAQQQATQQEEAPALTAKPGAEGSALAPGCGDGVGT